MLRVLLLSLFLLTAAGAQTTVAVTTDGDEYAGALGTANAGCSLREAIETVNTGAPFGGCAVAGAGAPVTITLPAGLYLLTRNTARGTTSGSLNRDDDLDVTAPVRIVGAGAERTYLSGRAQSLRDRLFEIRGPAARSAMPVEISGLTISGGYARSGFPDNGRAGAPGGAIVSVNAALTLTDVVVSDSFAGTGDGANDAPAGDGAPGGGIYAEGGSLTLVRTVVRGNTSGLGGTGFEDDATGGDSGSGGGIYTTGTAVALVDAEIRDNRTAEVGRGPDGVGRGGAGGGLYVAGGTLSMTRTTIAGNATVYTRFGVAGGPGGGLVLNGTTAEGVDVRIEDNQTSLRAEAGGAFSAAGGGVYSQDSQLTLRRSAVVGNRTSDGRDGVTFSRGGSGGGLFVSGGALVMEQSLVAGNTAGRGGDVTVYSGYAGDGGSGGGIYALAPVTLTDVTLSGNAAGRGGASTGTSGDPGDPGEGGGLFGWYPSTLQNVTVTRNDAAGAGGGVAFTTERPRVIANSIVAGNTSGTALADCAGPGLTDGGFNVVGASCPATSRSTVAVAPSAVFTAVLDSALADNGGPTLTHAPLAGSPAVDIGGTCAPVDQRGFEAPVGAACDAGAVERSGVTVATGTEAPAVFGLGAPFPNPSRGAARVPFALAEAGRVRVSVVDVLGREVLVLRDGEAGPGAHEALVSRGALPAGRYLVRLVGAEGTQSVSLTVVR